MLKRKFRTLVMLACALSIMVVAFDGRITPVKAQLTPICTTLNTMTTLLGGDLDSCVSTGSPQLLILDARASFRTQLLAQLMAQQSLVLLGQDLETELHQVGTRWVVDLELNQ